MADETQKVAGQVEETAEKTTEAKEDAKRIAVKKIAFPIADAMRSDKDGNVVSAVNADGKLLAVPKSLRNAEKKVVYAGYDPRKHQPLKKDDFISIADYLRYQAFVARFRAAILVASATAKETKADHLEKFGDEATRKRVTKAKKMMEQLAALTEQLKADGVNVNDI